MGRGSWLWTEWFSSLRGIDGIYWPYCINEPVWPNHYSNDNQQNVLRMKKWNSQQWWQMSAILRILCWHLAVSILSYSETSKVLNQSTTFTAKDGFKQRAQHWNHYQRDAFSQPSFRHCQWLCYEKNEKNPNQPTLVLVNNTSPFKVSVQLLHCPAPQKGGD